MYSREGFGKGDHKNNGLSPKRSHILYAKWLCCILYHTVVTVHDLMSDSQSEPMFVMIVHANYNKFFEHRLAGFSRLIPLV